MSEKRTAPRIPASISVAISRAGYFLKAPTVNISSSGVFIKTDSVLPIDTDLALRIRLPEDMEVMDIVGRVVWAKQTTKESPAGMGIEFIGISFKDKRKIQRFVESRLQERQKGHGIIMAAGAALR